MKYKKEKTLGIRTRAIQYANEFDWATLAIDAPGHGDRISREEAARLMEEVSARVRGDRISARRGFTRLPAAW